MAQTVEQDISVSKESKLFWRSKAVVLLISIAMFTGGILFAEHFELIEGLQQRFNSQLIGLATDVSNLNAAVNTSQAFFAASETPSFSETPTPNPTATPLIVK